MVSASRATEPSHQHHRELGEGGGAECEEADLERPDAFLARLQGRVDRVGGVVAVRLEDRQHETLEPGGVLVPAVVMVPFGRLLVSVVVRHRGDPPDPETVLEPGSMPVTFAESPARRWCSGTSPLACSAW